VPLTAPRVNEHLVLTLPDGERTAVSLSDDDAASGAALQLYCRYLRVTLLVAAVFMAVYTMFVWTINSSADNKQ
jgi:hypothetical protein